MSCRLYPTDFRPIFPMRLQFLPHVLHQSVLSQLFYLVTLIVGLLEEENRL